MTHLGNGRWAKELLLPPGHYEYRFVVNRYKTQANCDDRAGRYQFRILDDNGCWVDDLDAHELVRDPNGGFKAVLEVRPPCTHATEIAI